MKESTAEIRLNGTSFDLDGQRFVTLEITDAESRQLVCVARFTGDEIVSMLAGQVLSDHPITWYAPDKIGWTWEIRRIYVTVPEVDFNIRAKAARGAVDAVTKKLQEENPTAEVMPHYDDATNPHRRVAPNEYAVTFAILHPPAEGENTPDE